MKKIKAGSFKTMNLNYKLLRNIPFSVPTPIQRKTIPLLLERRSLMGIGRTGSGKTLAYLIPVIQWATERKKSLILLPTKELVIQVKRVLKDLTRGMIEERRLVQVSTMGSYEETEIEVLVVDEIDRILEESDLRKEFEYLNEKITGQKIFFSATKPDFHLNIKMIEIEAKIPEGIRHHFFYLPSESKEGALLYILNQNIRRGQGQEGRGQGQEGRGQGQEGRHLSTTTSHHTLPKHAVSHQHGSVNPTSMQSVNRIIIFCSTKYAVEYLIEVLSHYGIPSKGIYSSMDEESRSTHFRGFLKGDFNILVVTDVAARGLDIPLLDVVVNYDLTDEKTFLHRVGRIRGLGSQYSFVVYSDVFHFFNIQETYLTDVEIGKIPQSILDMYSVRGFERGGVERGREKCLRFRKKVSCPEEYKERISKIGVHSMFKQEEKLSDQLRKMNSGRMNGGKMDSNNNTGREDTGGSKDQFYIPYSRKDGRIHSSAFQVNKDDYVVEQKDKKEKRRIQDKKRKRRV